VDISFSGDFEPKFFRGGKIKAFDWPELPSQGIVGAALLCIPPVTVHGFPELLCILAVTTTHTFP
jgi:hypothetical protein